MLRSDAVKEPATESQPIRGDVPRLLRLGGEWQSKNNQGEGDETHDPPHAALRAVVGLWQAVTLFGFPLCGERSG